MIFGNSTIIVKNMLGKTPKTLNAVNVISGAFVDQMFFVSDGVMFAQALQGIVASKLVCKIYRALSGFLANNGHQLFSRNTLHNTGINPAIALQKPKNNAFALGSASALSFAPAAKVALIHFNLTRELATLKLRYVVDCFSQTLVHSCHCLVINIKIVSQFIRRLTLVESFQYPKFSSQLFERLLFSTGLVAALRVPSASAIDFERTAKNTLSTPLKVGRTTENVLLPCNHMDILTSTGCDYH